MKKLLAIVLSVAMMFSVTLTAFATETEAEVPETTEWTSELLETVRAFEGEHAEYKDMWYELVEIFRSILGIQLKAVMEDVAAFTELRFSLSDTDPELIDEMKEMDQEMATLIQSVTNYRIGKVFALLDSFAEDGEADIPHTHVGEEPDVTKEDVQAVVDKFNAFTEMHPELSEKCSAEFRARDKVLTEALRDAFDEARTMISTSFNSYLFVKYDVPEETQKEIYKMINALFAGINSYVVDPSDDFVDLVGPLSFLSGEQAESTMTDASLNDMQMDIRQFEAQHKDYAHMWYEFMDSFDKIFLEEFAAAFDACQAATENDFSTSDTDPELVEEMRQMDADMNLLINSAFRYHTADLFSFLDLLAVDGEVDIPHTHDNEAYRVDEEDFQALKDRFVAFTEAHPELAEKCSEHFQMRNERLNEVYGQAFKNIRDRMGDVFQELFAKYSVPEEDQETILDLIDAFFQNINRKVIDGIVVLQDYIGPIQFTAED